MCCPDTNRPNTNEQSANRNKFRVEDLPPPGRCGNQVADKIVGGEETGIYQYPWYLAFAHHYSIEESITYG